MRLDNQQIVELIMHNRMRLISYARSIACDFHTAEDIYQKMCLKAIQSSEAFEDADHLLKWAWIVCRNEALKSLRNQKNSSVVLDEQIIETIQNAFETPSFMDDPETLNLLEECISKLSMPTKKLLEYRYKHNLSGPKLAASLNKNVKTVYVAISRAHRALHDCMSRQLKMERG
jgi:RNA polymerase sigma-70 factor, ECF subfamily